MVNFNGQRDHVIERSGGVFKLLLHADKKQSCLEVFNQIGTSVENFSGYLFPVVCLVFYTTLLKRIPC